MKRNFNLYFDMDDTIVDFGSNKSPDEIHREMNQPGFFKQLKPLPFLSDVNNLALIMPQNFHIVSACISEKCMEEKIVWLKKYLPNADKTNVIFTVTGQNKAKTVLEIKNDFNHSSEMFLTPYDILVDDYSMNLKEWEALGGTAIKFQNSFNTADPKRYKYIIKNLSEMLQVLQEIRNDLHES